jgi:molybdopterin-containing oxidoreductase family membrane subunit
MTEKLTFSKRTEFISKLKGLLESGISPKKLKVVMPHPDHEVDEIVEKYVPPSKLKYFTLAGGLSGFIGGFALTIGTVLDWPLITGGKPLISIPAFIVIVFEMTILLGATASLLGFLILSRLPSFKSIISPEEYGNEFVIIMDKGDK